MRLAHLHLPNPIAYPYSLRLQESILQRHFAYRDALRSGSHLPFSHPPPPTLLTFSSSPVYTVGRRHLRTNPLSESQIAYLISAPPERIAEFYPSPRGGLLSYHAPGQLTAYGVIDLRAHAITPRCYIRMLERAVMRTCAVVGVEGTETTKDPGVWIKSSDRKVCAVGVQVTRGVTSHGIGLNVEDSEGWLGWGFDRIVACGLEGKSVTWLSREGAKQVQIENVASVLAEEFRKGLEMMGKVKVDGIDLVNERDVLGEEGGR